MECSGSDDGEWVWVRLPTLAEAVEAAATEQQKSPSAAEMEEEERPLKVVFASPAEYFTDAAPIGNGSLGGMVWGGVATEKLQLNHDTLWTGAPGNYTDPEAPAALAVVRELVNQGRFADATEAATHLFGGQSEVSLQYGFVLFRFSSYNIFLQAAYDSYKRELDLHTATVLVTYNIGEMREHFCSNPHQVIVTKISANIPGQLVMEGICPSQRPSLRKGNSTDVSEIKFAAVLGLQIGGNTAKATVVNGQQLRLDNADWVVLVVAASSSFNGPFVNPADSELDPTSIALNTLNLTRNLTYDQLKALPIWMIISTSFTVLPYSSHEDRRTHIVFGGEIRTSADRVKSFSIDEDPSLVELLFQYGRYLLISCSRPGTQVSNLQGIWNQDVAPAWDAAPHLNINLRMNYWPALPCNLSECQEPLFDFLASLAVNGSKTAKVNYQSSGWVTHHVTDICEHSSAFLKNPKHAVWPMGGAWLCTHLWEHYQFSLDKDLLENKAYPLLEGCATFLVDWLIEGQGGYLETNPSTSPEHAFLTPDGQPASVSYSTTMDISIIREVFSAVLLSAEVLGKSDTDLVKNINKALPRLPPVQIARDRTIMEWALDFQDPEVHHRHLSHLFGLYPGHTITLEKNADVCEAAANSLYKRGEDGPGWSTTWKMALWARLFNSENAYRMVLKLITIVPLGEKVDFEGGLYNNLWTAHLIMGLDRFTAAIAEMLLQSTQNDLYMLPALPRDKWPGGCVKGFRARGDVTVNICWDEGELQEALLWSNHGNSVTRLHYGELVTTIAVSSSTVYKCW
ncbi:hypothetical protein PVAP13_6KG161900 [Panicum virgatum]|uniref:Glycosyl hydrolase family 95 N-terminal domain-containing protein n=1 Tax=Panicum virgatum TaxID=38727 RepID=A0A8T0RC99_PANVG|nr:hypothetical protein PVAP13_6KG161900 [Panicum virgatum]